jgi:hypothetical protein
LEIREYLRTNFKEWKVVTLADLDPDDKLVYSGHHPNGCPGFTSGTYKSSDTGSFAVVINSNDKPHRSKLLVFDKVRESYEATILWELPDAPGPVVFTMPAGTYLNWERDQEITTERPVIFYVHYEASAWMFYWSEGKWQELQVSD